MLASSLIFNCYWSYTYVYLLAHLCAVIAAALVSIALYGRGPHYLQSQERPTDTLRESLLSETEAGRG